MSSTVSNGQGQPSEGVLDCGGTEVFYREYGSRDRPAVLAVHGLGGQGWNFHPLASALQSSYHVVCPDLPGRGRSQWSSDPATDYCSERYQSVLLCLIDALGIDTLSWVGTSMGGAVGVYCAGGDWHDRISSLILNDIGPELPPQVMKEIAAAAGADPEFPGYQALAEHLARFLGELAGQTTDAEHWLRFALAGARRTDRGTLALHHDPRIAMQLEEHPNDYSLWQRYDRIRCPTLLLRGALSTVLSQEMAELMTIRGPRATLVTFEGWGHAPFLESGRQIAIVRDFLQRVSP